MIAAEGVGYRYGSQGKPIFSDLGFRWPTGSVTGLLGRNGTGKTTLLHLLAGLRFPGQGSLEVAGMLPRQRSAEFRRRVLLVPDRGNLPEGRVADLARRFGPLYPRFSVPLFDQIGADFRLDPGGQTHKLSLGERKKVWLTFALASGVQVLLFDEPTEALDIPAKEVLRRRVAAFAADGGTVVVSTHQVRDLDQLFDRLTILHQGRLIADRPRHEIEAELERRGEPLDGERYFALSLEAADSEVSHVVV